MSLSDRYEDVITRLTGHTHEYYIYSGPKGRVRVSVKVMGPAAFSPQETKFIATPHDTSTGVREPDAEFSTLDKALQHIGIEPAKPEESETWPVQVHRIEVLVVDHDGLGAEGVREVLEHTRYPNRCIRPEVMDIETREVAWNDDHPLNNKKTTDAAYEALFGEGMTAKTDPIKVEERTYRCRGCGTCFTAGTQPDCNCGYTG